MKVIAPDGLYHCNYSIDVVNSRKKYWDVKNTYSCIGNPKEKNILLYLDGVEAEYTLPDGKKIHAKSGDLIYTPMGSEYSVRIYGKARADSNTVGTNFFLFDETGEPFLLSRSILVFEGVDCGTLVKKINDASEALSRPCFSEMKAGFYDILTLLSRKQKRKDRKKFQVIERGIAYMEEDLSQECSIGEVARSCNVSEIYFRRLFKEYSGLSPMEYRLKRRIERAKNYLAYEDISVAEIAERLGFVDAAYFCKQFKAYTGVTPLGFKRDSNGREQEKEPFI